MNPLYDKAKVRALAKAVKRRNPADWKASLKYKRAKADYIKCISGVFAVSITSLAFIVLACFPFFQPDLFPSTSITAGLMAFNLMVIGLITAKMLMEYRIPSITPLVNTPISSREVYLYALVMIRREFFRKSVQPLIGAFIIVIVTRLLIAGPSWRVVWEACIGAAALLGITMGCGLLLHYLVNAHLWIKRLIYIPLAFLVIWEVLSFFENRPVSPPLWLGEAMQIFPLTKIIEWFVADRALPWGLALACASSLPLVIFWFMHLLRDQGECSNDDLLDEPDGNRAEFIAAAAVKHWRKAEREEAYAREMDEEEVDEHDDFSDDSDEKYEGPLLMHPEAPQEHATPVSEEYRQEIANRCRILLDAKKSDCPLHACTVPDRAQLKPTRLAWRCAIWAGILPPLLIEVEAWLPEAWNKEYGFLFPLAALFILVLTPILSYRVIPHTLPISHSEWVRLPMDPGVHTRHFFKWQNALLWQRCQLILVVVCGLAVTSSLLLGLRHLLNITGESPLIAHGWIYGEGSLAIVALGLFTVVLAMRSFEALNFYGAFFRYIQFNGFWKRLSSLYAFVVVIYALVLMIALFSAWAFTSAEVNQQPPWAFPLGCFLFCELLHRLNRWITLRAARWGNGDLLHELM